MTIACKKSDNEEMMEIPVPRSMQKLKVRNRDGNPGAQKHVKMESAKL